MKVFQINSRVVDGKPVVNQITCSLSVDEIACIRDGLSKIKPSNNEVVESIRTHLVEQFNLY